MINKSSLTFLIALTAAIAGLLFGYDVGIISGAIIFIQPDFSMSASEVGMVVSAVAFGALFASLSCGKFGDKYGRKNLLIITATLFLIGSIVCGFANSALILTLGRLILGVAVGLGSFTAPLYISEISPKNIRGRLVTLNQLAITIGICLAYSVNLTFAASGLWRIMLLLGAVPALILLIMCIFLPKSPRWLLANNQENKANEVLSKIHDQQTAQKELIEIKHALSTSKDKTSIFRRKYLKVLLLGITISIVTQAVGINAIIYYAPTIFKLTGFAENKVAILATLGIGLTNVIFTLIAIVLLDKFGRRKLLLTGLLGIIISLCLITYAFYHELNATSLAWLALFSMTLFVACQAFSTGPACWLIPSEIFPTKVRSTGMGISVACNWGTNVVVAFLFPVILTDYGAVPAFSIFLIIAITGWLYVFIKLPETKNISLETIEENIEKGTNLRDLGKSIHTSPTL